MEHFSSSFLTYVEDTWFNCYSMEDWNQYDNSTMEHLTNNSCQGGNLRILINPIPVGGRGGAQPHYSFIVLTHIKVRQMTSNDLTIPLWQ